TEALRALWHLAGSVLHCPQDVAQLGLCLEHELEVLVPACELDGPLRSRPGLVESRKSPASLCGEQRKLCLLARRQPLAGELGAECVEDRKSTRLNSSHDQ